MVEFITVGLVGFGAGVVTTLALGLLIAIYRNTVGCNDKEEEDNHPFIIPMSQIPGHGGGGGYTAADIQRAAAMMRQAQGEKPPEETKDAKVGTYL